MSLRAVKVKVYLGLLAACGCNAIFGIEQPTLIEEGDAGKSGVGGGAGGLSSDGRGGASSGGAASGGAPSGAGGRTTDPGGMAGDGAGGAGEGGAFTGGAMNTTGGASSGASSLGGSTSASSGGVTGAGGSGKGGSSGASAGGATSSGGKTSSGGASSGGKTSSGGTTSSGGASTGGSGPTNPPGYWTQGSLHGCAWADTDHNSPALSSVTPQDFTAKAAPPYCISGSVGGYDDYSGIAMLGFNLAQSPPASCTYNPTTATTSFPPVEVTGAGVAFTLTKNAASPLRVLLYGANGATNENRRWCSVVTATSGKVFVPFSSFNTQCWDNQGNTYANEPIASIVFYVYGPGQGQAATPYNFCVNGPAFGANANAAP